MAEEKNQLIRGLTLTGTTALVIGTVIGTGVFLKAAPMAQGVGTPTLVMVAWVAAGLLTLAGALTYAELGAMLPHAGGEYVYLRHSYGDASAFLFGWQRFIVAGSASIAALGAGFAVFLSAFLPLNQVWAERKFTLFDQTINWQFGSKQLVAVGAILLLSALNCLTVAFGGKVQSVLTVLKIAGLAAVIAGVFFFAPAVTWSNLATPAGTQAWSGFAAFGVAMLAALWAYDGWNNMPMAAGEVQQPGRNIPRALIGGMIVVMVIYCLANLAYFYALPLGEVVTSNSTAHRDALPVASKAAQSFLGESGGRFVALAFVVSALGALNGSILSNARVPYAMARDGVFFASHGPFEPDDARPGGRHYDSSRLVERPGAVRHLRPVDRLPAVRLMDILRPVRLIGLRAAAQGAQRGAALQNAGLSGDAAGLRARGDLAGDQHVREQAGGVGDRARSDRIGIAVVFLLQAAARRAKID